MSQDYIEYNRFDPNVLMKRAEDLGDDWRRRMPPLACWMTLKRI